MTLFKETIDNIKSILEEAKKNGHIREYVRNHGAIWPEGRSLVLQEDTAMELGSEQGSLFMIAWGEKGSLPSPGHLSLLGPDLSESESEQLPLGLIVLVRGDFTDDYKTYQDILDVIFDSRLEGVSVRVWPERQRVWCRVSHKALDNNFSLQSFGNVLLENLTGQEFVEEAEVILVSNRDYLERLAPLSSRVKNILDALTKMYEEMDFDCDNCDYQEICEEVENLKKIRENLRKEKEGA